MFFAVKAWYLDRVKMHLKTYWIITIVCIALLGCVLLYREVSCVEVMPQKPIMSSHGWKVWFGSSLQSFEHNGKRICIPDDWEPVGEAEKKLGWARFPEGASGVLIQSSDFEFRTVQTENNSYVLRVVYQKSMAPELASAYIETITQAFNRVGGLFPNTKGQSRTHTVLITVGVAGDGNDFETSVYPDPSEEISIFVRNVEHKRAEELFIHAAAHLYNRYRTDLTAYQNTQSPILSPDWQEMEAAWTEVAFRSSPSGRTRRLAELYDVHRAIQTNTFSESLIFPFSERELFDAVTQRAIAIKEDSVYSDYQYGHYVLAPLVMVAIEGLLLQYNTDADISKILYELHTGTESHFLDTVRAVLPANEILTIERWMDGRETIPHNLVLSASKYYEKSLTQSQF